ncbi:acyl-ACP--UDP-N-acetylglucosamine O-acyltransferase [Henriciella aquimarina]|uniref:acyl-ACP--UDP-N-acetylglucosamine O-acyltransferase n=1 Tax=Henriciella aquimarina TaxID=545261 RepID=UPI001F473B15|nr:acyl-ACP--UDP-N-acetylglucosamine O-acyltransferase [Henriciella aquimarina]
MSVEIHPTAIVEDGAQLGEDVSVGAFAFVGAQTTLGDGCRIHQRATVTGLTELGSEVEVFPGAVIGTAPQILGFKDDGTSRITIGKQTVIREHVTIHGGSPAHGGLTSVGDNCLMMVGAHIAHDCHVGDKCVFANNVALGGHIVVGDQVWMGGLAAVHQFCRIGRHAFVGGGAIVVADIIPYGSVIGNHAHLAGLNIVGMKRRGFSRQTIHDLRAAYRMLFAKEGTFSERVADAEESYGDCPELVEIIEFIRASKSRSLCLPE